MVIACYAHDMRRLIFLLAVFVFNPGNAAAEGPDTKRLPQFDGKYAPVPDPIPAGYKRCVRIVVRLEHQRKWGRLPVFDPPINSEDAALLNRTRKRNIGRYEHCRELNA